MTWISSLSGRPIELLAPTPEEVNWDDLAHAMAHLNRFNGNACVPVSVGLHTLVGLHIAPVELRPWWLIHDAHETRTGEVASPVKEALAAIAIELFGVREAKVIGETRRDLEARHDAAIHAAAGLPLPTGPQREALKAVDLTALATERRDFCGSGTRPWMVEREGIAPAPGCFTWRYPRVVAAELGQAFRDYLPGLNGGQLP